MTWWHKVISHKLISQLAHNTREPWTGARPESTSALEALQPTSYCQYLRFQPINLLSPQSLDSTLKEASNAVLVSRPESGSFTWRRGSGLIWTTKTNAPKNDRYEM